MYISSSCPTLFRTGLFVFKPPCPMGRGTPGANSGWQAGSSRLEPVPQSEHAPPHHSKQPPTPMCPGLTRRDRMSETPHCGSGWDRMFERSFLAVTLPVCPNPVRSSFLTQTTSPAPAALHIHRPTRPLVRSNATFITWADFIFTQSRAH